jgi:molecular chaperone GrpE
MDEEKKESKEQKEEKDEHVDAKKAEKEESAELKERLLRLAAEFDNYKKRIIKDLDNSKGVGKAELIRKLLPALDEFELALNAIEGNTGNAKKGLELVYSNLISTLKNEGLETVETNGRFDPYKHEIILTKWSKEKEGTIIEVVRKGYTFNGMLIRPASVIIAREEKKDNTSKEEKI